MDDRRYSPASVRAELERITRIFLNPADAIDNIRAADALYELLCTASGLAPHAPENRADLHLPCGKALGTAWAAYCIRDVNRTRCFIRGIFKAAQRLRERFPERPLELLYAGTGPFATLVLPLITAFSARDIQFTFIEIQPESVASLQKIVDIFDMRGYVREIVQADAAEYRFGQCFDLAVVETMQAALRQEPQIAVTRNAAAQLLNTGILIPERIMVSAGVFNPTEHWKYSSNPQPGVRNYHQVGEPVICVSIPAEPEKEQKFPEHRIVFDRQRLAAYPQPALFTQIQVFEDEILDYWDCTLTEPFNLPRPEHPEHDAVLYLRYEQCGQPGFVHQWST